jgi:prolycopene isomerase
MYCRLERGDFSNVGHMVRVSPDSRTVLAFFNAPFKSDLFWTRHKNEVANAFLDQVEQYLPSLKSHIIYLDAATPSTLRRYTLNYRGAAFGWAKMPSQTFNPLFLRRSILNGLYLTGHWTSIAFGMPGACYSGFDTAKRILRNAKKDEMPSR